VENERFVRLWGWVYLELFLELLSERQPHVVVVVVVVRRWCCRFVVVVVVVVSTGRNVASKCL